MKQKNSTTNQANGIEQKIQENKRGNYICFILLFLFSVLIAFAWSAFVGQSIYEITRNCILISGLSLVIIFRLYMGIIHSTYEYDNGEHLTRFIILFCIGLCVSFVYSKLPVAGWMIMIFYVMLSRVSDEGTGIVAGSTVLLFTCLLSNNMSAAPVLVYLISGMMAVTFFSHVDSDFKIGFPLFLSVSCQMATIAVGLLLMQNKKLGLEDAIVPIVNAIINAILICFFMQIYNSKIASKERILYQTINDPEYPIMLEKKNSQKEEYFRSIHTAYLAERICKALKLNVDAAKTAAYYHHFSENELSKINIPKEGMYLIEQLKGINRQIKRKETVVICICDAVITTIQQLLEKKQNEPLQYETVIKVLFQKKLTPTLFIDSEITLRDLRFIEKKLIEEKLYYDFLR